MDPQLGRSMDCGEDRCECSAVIANPANPKRAASQSGGFSIPKTAWNTPQKQTPRVRAGRLQNRTDLMIRHSTQPSHIDEPSQLSPVAAPAPATSLVNARDIHAELGVRKDFNYWMRSQIKKHGLTEGVDFFGVSCQMVGNSPK